MTEKRFEENMSLVRFVLKKYVSTSLEMGAYSIEDLYQVGCIGLWKAIQTHDPAK